MILKSKQEKNVNWWITGVYVSTRLKTGLLEKPLTGSIMKFEDSFYHCFVFVKIINDYNEISTYTIYIYISGGFSIEDREEDPP